MGSAAFITIEGTEGAGKTTQMERIKAFLEDRGHSVIVTREPGGTDIAEHIRHNLLKSVPSDTEQLTDHAELLLFFAARAQHIEQIKRWLAQGYFVLCDRFTLSTYAYQGHGRRMGEPVVADLEAMVQGAFAPHRTYVLEVPPAVSRTRVEVRGEAQDRFEQEQDAFFERVRTGFEVMARKRKATHRVIDATQPVEIVTANITQDLCDHVLGG